MADFIDKVRLFVDLSLRRYNSLLFIQSIFKNMIKPSFWVNIKICLNILLNDAKRAFTGF